MVNEISRVIASAPCSVSEAESTVSASCARLAATTPIAEDGFFSVDYLIIGNSAAGVSAAEALRSVDADGSIMMVSDEPYPAYGRPLISYLLEGKADADRLGYRDKGFYEENRIQTLFGPDCRVAALDAAAHKAVCLDGTSIAYRKCLVATGSVAFVPEIDGAEGRVNVHRFMTLDDALGVWRDAADATERAHAEGRDSRAIVIGGGLIGMKAAEALSHHVDDVVVFERNDRILPAVLDAEGAGIAQRLLASRGISCRPGVTASALLGDGDRVNCAHLTDGTDLPCDVVVLAVGVRPATSLAVDAGAEQGRGLVVNSELMTTLPDVYAAGDVTQVTDRLTGAQRPLALWPNAVHQGRIAGLRMAGSSDAPTFEDSFAVNAVDFYDISLLTSGIINPVEGDGTHSVVREEGDTYAKFVVRDDRLVGYVLLNRPDDAGIYTALIESGTPLSALAREEGGEQEGHEAVFGRAVRNLDFPAEARWARLHKFYPRNRDELGRERKGGDGA